ncbi:MAG: sortase [Candidatus Azambacteria bacterium]|nr:sortase [Candidatus Azambacteria bacterium]
MLFNPKKELIIFSIIFLASSALVYFALNGGAYSKILKYELFSSYAEASADDKLISGLDEKNYYLYIPKIEVLAPAIRFKDNSEKNVLAILEKGVGLYVNNSQLPGKAGRAVILGHSSKETWYHRDGQYSYNFALLDKLQKGDEIYVVFEGKKLIYKVFSNDILTPEKTNEILSQKPKGDSEIALITCWPIGFSLKRVLIQAELIGIEKI